MGLGTQFCCLMVNQRNNLKLDGKKHPTGRKNELKKNCQAETNLISMKVTWHASDDRGRVNALAVALTAPLLCRSIGLQFWLYRIPGSTGNIMIHQLDPTPRSLTVVFFIYGGDH